jgi:hypothetical protein
MFSGVMAQEALEGNVAGTVHFDMRNVTLTPTLPAGTHPGFSDADFHSSSEARQGIALLASTGPGERQVDVVIQHEEGVSTIGRQTNAVRGARLPSRLADRMPNIDNNPTTTPAGGSSSNSGGSSTSASLPVAPGGGAATVGSFGRNVVPLAAEAETVLLNAAYRASGSSVTSPLVTPLLTAAAAVPVVAGVAAIGVGTGHAVRAGAEALGANAADANILGLEAAVLTGAALGSVIPGVGTAVGAGIGALVAGGIYIWSL